MSERTTKPDIHVLALDETEFWSNLDPIVAANVAAFYTVYVYDANEVTHLCELAGSYFLQAIDAHYDYKEGVEVSDEDSEHINEWITGAWSKAEDHSHYRHVGDVEKMLSDLTAKGLHVHAGDLLPNETLAEINDMGENKMWDMIIEALQSNPPIC